MSWKPLVFLGVDQIPNRRKRPPAADAPSLPLMSGQWNSVLLSQWRLFPCMESRGQSHYSSGRCPQAKGRRREVTAYPGIQAPSLSLSIPGWAGKYRWCPSSGDPVPCPGPHFLESGEQHLQWNEETSYGKKKLKLKCGAHFSLHIKIEYKVVWLLSGGWTTLVLVFIHGWFFFPRNIYQCPETFLVVTAVAVGIQLV